MSDPLKVYTIQGKLGDGIIERLVKQMKDDGISDDLILHAIENQLIPQLFAEVIGDKKHAQVRMVNTNLKSEGHLVTCHKCGREARMLTAPPEGLVATCPECLMKVAEDQL